MNAPSPAILEGHPGLLAHANGTGVEQPCANAAVPGALSAGPPLTADGTDDAAAAVVERDALLEADKLLYVCRAADRFAKVAPVAALAVASAPAQPGVLGLRR